MPYQKLSRGTAIYNCLCWKPKTISTEAYPKLAMRFPGQMLPIKSGQTLQKSRNTEFMSGPLRNKVIFKISTMFFCLAVASLCLSLGGGKKLSDALG